MITLTDYLMKRLDRLGIKDIFGLPGDFNFNILYSVEDNKNLQWINCTNELNAAYAADGYARVNGFGAVVTTYGVGELSAINGIAGSFAENIPVIKIAGIPSTKAIYSNALIHHNINAPDYHAFERAYKNVVETTAFLTKDNAKAEIDRIIEVMVKTRRPVYVAIPVDVCKIMVDDNIPEIEIKSCESNLNLALTSIKKVINKAESPVFVLDLLVKRFNLSKEMEDLINSSGIPFSNYIMGKGSVDETNPLFIGTNLGSVGSKITRNFIDKSDCLISVGALLSDLNTAGYLAMPREGFKIDIQADYVVVEGKKFENVLIKDVICELKSLIEKKNIQIPLTKQVDKDFSDRVLKVDDIFPVIEKYLRPKDTVCVETGILGNNSGLLKLPSDVSFHTQTLWGSIGWATPALFGAAVADRSRRPILITGEGSHQLTIQEVSNFFDNNIKPIILLLNNSGYTIERVLSKDPLDGFNNIKNWNYKKLIDGFSGGKEYFYASVRTQNELNLALEKASNESSERLCYIEMFTDMLDAPKEVYVMINNIKEYNSKL
ncbi:MAG: thiamine pyrophosphate-binding protein [Candidatus Gastranaerophilales bacterium]|nr:thiamine pyrophosphate-binding protein [Candidatus Gastranaerophilales bacterium]